MRHFPKFDQTLILIPKNGKPIFIFVCRPILMLSVTFSSEFSCTTFLVNRIKKFGSKAEIFVFPFIVYGKMEFMQNH